MGKLLIDVLTLEKEGLVGFTEIGEQVPLSTPKLGVWISEHDVKDCVTQKDFVNATAELIKNLDEDSYFELGKIRLKIGVFLMPYNVYTRRE